MTDSRSAIVVFPQNTETLNQDNRSSLRGVWAGAVRRTAIILQCLGAGSLARSPGNVDSFPEETGWHPDGIGAFVGTLRYSKYGPLNWLLLKRIARDATGDVDTSEDYEDVRLLSGAFSRHSRSSRWLRPFNSMLWCLLLPRVVLRSRTGCRNCSDCWCTPPGCMALDDSRLAYRTDTDGVTPFQVTGGTLYRYHGHEKQTTKSDFLPVSMPVNDLSEYGI